MPGTADINSTESSIKLSLCRILPETLEEFLDSCAHHESHPMHEDFSVEFNYRSVWATMALY